MSKRKSICLSLLVILFITAIAFTTALPVRADVLEILHTDPAISYTGSWTIDYYHVTSQAGASFQYTFTGTSIILNFGACQDAGIVDVYLDSDPMEVVDLYSSECSNENLYTKTGLTLTSHTIRVVVTADKNSSSSFYYVRFRELYYDTGGAITPTPTSAPLTCFHGAGNQYDGDTPQFTCTQVDGAHIRITSTSITELNHHQAQWNLGGTGIVYGKVSNFSLGWSTGPYYPRNSPLSVIFKIKNSGRMWDTSIDNPTIYDCKQTPLPGFQSGVCSGSSIYAEAPLGAGTYATGLFFYGGQPQLSEGVQTFTLDLATYPLEEKTCASIYADATTDGPFDIDPTIEFPLGSTGSPADEQTFEVTTASVYAIRIAGGSWSDGTLTGRYDVAYSWDNITWHLLSEAGCVIKDPTNADLITGYVTALSSTIYIRANDEAGQFADNVLDDPEIPFQYFISLQALVGETDCTNQFTYDENTDLIASVTLPANVSSYPATNLLIPGDWYAIKISAGAWQDELAPETDRFDAQFAFGRIRDHVLLPDAIWHDIAEGGSDVFCAKAAVDPNYKIVFMQADRDSSLYLRVKDENLTFSTNTGSLDISIYHTTFTRRPTECELQYNLDSYYYHADVDAFQENGTVIGQNGLLETDTGSTIWPNTTAGSNLSGDYKLEPGAWYVLETNGGPWGWVGSPEDNSNGVTSYEGAIMDHLGVWDPLSTWAGAACNVQIDALGHRRIYFQVPADRMIYYWFRVNDTEPFGFNFGSLGYDLYKAYKMQVSLPDGSCDFTYDPENPINFTPIKINATHQLGDPLPTLDANSLYAIKIDEDENSWWAETEAGEHQYDVELSDDNGSTWHDLPANYGGVSCYFHSDGFTMLFIHTGSHYLYRMRVNSTSFSDNAGHMLLTVYSANVGETVDPWSTCLDGKSKDFINARIPIDVRNGEGEVVPISDSFQSSSTVIGYVVQIVTGTGPWKDGVTQTDHYDAQLSADNGDTWHTLEHGNPDILCAGQDQAHRYKWAYFTIQENQKWKIRVNDTGTSVFTDNSGDLAYALYAVVEGPPCSVGPGGACVTGMADFSGAINICTTAAVKPRALDQPPGILDVVGWLEYLSNIVQVTIPGWVNYGLQILQQWTALCPRHINALMALLDIFKNKEPMATGVEIDGVVTKLKNEMQSYKWDDSDAPTTPLTTGSNAGGTTNSIIGQLFPGSNPWSGGPLITPVQWHGNAHFNRCISNFSSLIGNEAVTTGTCFVSAAATEVGASFIFQLMLELAAVGFLITDLISQVKNLASFMAGGDATD